MKIKIIAGKIMPALITSTSSIAGLLALQLYVLSQNIFEGKTNYYIIEEVYPYMR